MVVTPAFLTWTVALYAARGGIVDGSWANQIHTEPGQALDTQYLKAAGFKG